MKLSEANGVAAILVVKGHWRTETQHGAFRSMVVIWAVYVLTGQMGVI